MSEGYPHDPEQEAIDIRRAIVRKQQASFENLIRAEERERIVKLLENEIKRVSNPMLVDREYLDGLEQGISLIKGEQNPNVRAETVASRTLNTANLGNSACSCGCERERINE
jgi:hypothetical protein